jgi:hypothetical protein
VAEEDEGKKRRRKRRRCEVGGEVRREEGRRQ